MVMVFSGKCIIFLVLLKETQSSSLWTPVFTGVTLYKQIVIPADQES